MRKILIGGGAGLVVAAVLTMLLPRVSAQGGYHVVNVTQGYVTCQVMTDSLRADRDTWAVVYYDYMAGFLTGANFVSYSTGGRNANVALDVPHETIFASIVQYCTQNPKGTMVDGIVKVYSQLVAR